jgi:iron complex outermembrane receptor protein
MFTNSKLAKSIRLAIAVGVASTAMVVPNVAIAQNADDSADMEKISVTGSRILRPGAVSASPIMSMDAEDIEFLQEPEIEKIIRILPGTIPGDGANVNNGSAGAATVNLRGLGTQRTLVLMNGRRMVPFNFNGQVDTATIPTALIERVDVVTGGASAVYGSDAVAGAVNFILKENFEGVALEYTHSQTGDSDGKKDNLSLTLGSNLAEDRGNIALSLSWMNRNQILLGDRPLGLLGINTGNGAGLEQFLAGEPH